LTTATKYLFGPVPSRRFGRSLGVDLTPFKTCSLDCIFCQLGHTTVKTLERREYVPTEKVLTEIGNWILEGGEADYITLAGSGEPTLHSGFGKVIDFIHSSTDFSVALLTNGTTLHLSEVRAAAVNADVVKVTLSAWDQKSFEIIHRPSPGVTFKQLLEGARKFRDEFKGRLWLEVFLLEGLNSSREDVRRISELVRQIRPDKTQLNTCVRPPAEEISVAVAEDKMAELAGLFEPSAEVIAEFRSDCPVIEVNEIDIVEMLRRRPCTAVQIADAFGMHPNEVSKYIGKLLRKKTICSEGKGIDAYYTAVKSKKELIIR
jgi:wyosine [tRNA(Phe)-imidazoG37] synthetase (radical SAM superfamily)